MASRRVTETNKKTTRRPPAKTPTAREHQLVGLAVDLAEQQIRDGTASSQVINHFLKLGSSREELEQEKIRAENDLLRAKIEDLAAQVRVEELYKEALGAMKRYAGQEPTESFDD